MNIFDIKDLVTPVLAQIEPICFAYLFGSYVTGNNGPLSDIDLAIYVKDGFEFTFQDKLAVHADLCRALKSNDVDLVVLNQMDNLIIHEKIIHDGELFYLVDKKSWDHYVFTVTHAICDFKWFRRYEVQV